MLSYLKEPFRDISISRPTARVSWAVPVPDDETQTVYVWLDALVNYLTPAGYPSNKVTMDMIRLSLISNYLVLHDHQLEEKWPPELQVIGKDILKFHGIYWPAFLIAAGLNLPKNLLVHSHWMMNNRKMSKSLGNVIDPHKMAERYTFEGIRYFLLREGVAHSDGSMLLLVFLVFLLSY